MKAETLDLYPMTISEDINTIIATGAAVTTAVIGFLSGRKSIKRADTDNDGAQLDNVAKAIGIWEDTATKLNAKVAVLEQANDTIQARLDTLRHLHDDCEGAKTVLADKVACLEGDVCALRAKVDGGI